MKELISRILGSVWVFVAAIVVIAGCAMGNLLAFTPQADWTFEGLWANRESVYGVLAVIYLLCASRYVMGLTPALVARLRGVVDTSPDQFDALAERIAGKWPVFGITLVALFLAGEFLVRFANILMNVSTRDLQALPHEMGWVFLPLEIVVLAFATWRMFWLSRLAVEPLKINLLNPAPTFPFSSLSFAYASILSLRMLLQFVLYGSVMGGMMANAFLGFGLMSVLMLVVPILGTHNQMQKQKDRALQEIDNELIALTQPIFTPGSTNMKTLEEMSRPMESLLGLRKRIATLWTWPVSNSLQAAQALVLSSLPVWLPLIKNYIWPIVQKLMS